MRTALYMLSRISLCSTAGDVVQGTAGDVVQGTAGDVLQGTLTIPLRLRSTK